MSGAREVREGRSSHPVALAIAWQGQLPPTLAARAKRKLSSARLRRVGQAEPLRWRMQPSVAGP